MGIVTDERMAGFTDKFPLTGGIVLNAIQHRCRIRAAIALFRSNPFRQTAAYPWVTAEVWGLAKIIRPADVCSAPVTITQMASPM